MSEENNEVKNPYTGTSKLSDYEVTSMLEKVKDGDMQVIARLIVEMKNENEAANKRVKMQSIFSLHLRMCKISNLYLLECKSAQITQFVNKCKIFQVKEVKYAR